MPNRHLPLAFALAAAACSSPQRPVPADAAAPQASASAAPASQTAPAGEASAVVGVVAETMNSGGYTYARLTADGADTWIAGNEFPVTVGDRVTATVDMPMQNFHSRTLNRDFPVIYFVRQVARNGETAAPTASTETVPPMAGSHGGADAASTVASASEPIAPAPGGVSVAEVWAKRGTLSGKTVVVRGRVVKANYEIMGRHWYHVQDGSGTAADGTNDLTVTSHEKAAVGEVVTVSGTLATSKDFGAGYAYEVMIEQAAIKR